MGTLLYIMAPIIVYYCIHINYMFKADIIPVYERQPNDGNTWFIHTRKFKLEPQFLWNNQTLLLTLVSTVNADSISEELLLFFKTYSLIQKNYNCRIIIFSSSTQILNMGVKYGILVVKNTGLNRYGKPIYPSMLSTAEMLMDSHFYGYINIDILLSTQLFTVLRRLLFDSKLAFLRHSYFMIAGRVSAISDYNISTTSVEMYENSFQAAYQSGVLRNPYSADYFCYYKKMMSRRDISYDESVVGRYYIDNWIMGSILVNHGHLIDTTTTIHGIHLGVDAYWKKNLRKWVALDDTRWNLRHVRRDYPWNYLTKANCSTYWNNSTLILVFNWIVS